MRCYAAAVLCRDPETKKQHFYHPISIASAHESKRAHLELKNPHFVCRCASIVWSLDLFLNPDRRLGYTWILNFNQHSQTCYRARSHLFMLYCYIPIFTRECNTLIHPICTSYANRYTRHLTPLLFYYAEYKTYTIPRLFSLGSGDRSANGWRKIGMRLATGQERNYRYQWTGSYCLRCDLLHRCCHRSFWLMIKSISDSRKRKQSDNTCLRIQCSSTLRPPTANTGKRSRAKYDKNKHLANVFVCLVGELLFFREVDVNGGLSHAGMTASNRR